VPAIKLVQRGDPRPQPADHRQPAGDVGQCEQHDRVRDRAERRDRVRQDGRHRAGVPAVLHHVVAAAEQGDKVEPPAADREVGVVQVGLLLGEPRRDR
jgi:hypothetical protein